MIAAVQQVVKVRGANVPLWDFPPSNRQPIHALMLLQHEMVT